MRRILILLCLYAAAVFCLSAPVLAQDAQIPVPSHPAQPGNAAKVQELQRIIEEQQRQLDAQQEQLEAQKKKLQELRQQVQGLAERAAPPQAARTPRPREGTKNTRTTTGKGPSGWRA